jgi:protein tyrosine/serine phosphatase
LNDPFVRAFYILDGSYIDATCQQILQDYQSIDGYLSKGLGLTDDEVRKLRERLRD